MQLILLILDWMVSRTRLCGCHTCDPRLDDSSQLCVILNGGNPDLSESVTQSGGELLLAVIATGVHGGH